MPLPLKFACGLVLMTAVTPIAGLAQEPRPQPPILGRRLARTPRQEPCWEQAGVSKAAMQERRSLEQSSRAEIQSVCANSSLTPQQRREQIRAIRQRTRQQVDGIITPQQREAIKSCREARGHTGGGGFHGGGGGGGRGEGPCGELNEPKETEPERQP